MPGKVGRSERRPQGSHLKGTMGQVTVTLNGRTFRLQCGDGEEQRLHELADHVGQRVEQLAMQFGHYGDERLLLMATLAITDEMFDLRSRLDAGGHPLVAARENAGTAPHGIDCSPTQPPDIVSTDVLPTGTAAPRDSEPAPGDVEATAEPAPSEPRPMLRRGSLEARLAQARVGAPPKTGT